MSPSDVTVFSLNIRFGLADDGPNGWRHRKKFFPLLVNHYPADFYAFQEVNDFQARDLQAILTDYRFIGQRDRAPSYWQNNLIFYHRAWRCAEQYHFYLSQTPDVPSKFDDSKWPRQCTMGVFQQANRWLVCVNTHFDFAETVQEKSARIILTQLSRLSVTEPVIIMGDFNATPDGRCFHIFTKSPPGKKKTAMEPIGHRFKSVFQPSFPATYHGFSGETEGDHIDWVLYRGPIGPQKKRVLRDNFNGHYPSDHFPLFVRFQW